MVTKQAGRESVAELTKASMALIIATEALLVALEKARTLVESLPDDVPQV